jgi:hypothetical protein
MEFKRDYHFVWAIRPNNTMYYEKRIFYKVHLTNLDGNWFLIPKEVHEFVLEFVFDPVTTADVRAWLLTVDDSATTQEQNKKQKNKPEDLPPAGLPSSQFRRM